MKKLFDFYLRSSLHVGLCMAALFLSLHPHLSVESSMIFLVSLISLTVMGYNITKYFSRTVKKLGYRFKMPILILSLISAIGILPLLLFGTVYSMLVLITILLLGFTYNVPIIFGKSLRHFPVVKLVSVALVWVLLLKILPIYLNQEVFFSSEMKMNFESLYYNRYKLLIDCTQIFILVIALCIPFEIRDLKYDDEDLNTLPQMIGVQKSKWIGVILCTICITLQLLIWNKVDPTVAIINSSAFILTAILILGSNKNRSDYYASFWVEAVPIFWLVALWVFI